MALIRQLREAKGLSPSEVETRSGGVVQKGTLNAIERGMVQAPSYPLVTALAQALQVSAAVCYEAIAETAQAKKSNTLPKRTVGRPPARAPRSAPAVTLEGALADALKVVATLEQLTTTGGR
jgi:transcriptional regulator with XRE-family HTH domain